MHNKEQHEEADYYKELGEIIRNYNDVVLFGPTEAKVELYNFLRKDHRFADIVIEIKPADKMTENQQHAFVREYFFKTIISDLNIIYDSLNPDPLAFLISDPHRLYCLDGNA